MALGGIIGRTYPLCPLLGRGPAAGISLGCLCPSLYSRTTLLTEIAVGWASLKMSQTKSVPNTGEKFVRCPSADKKKPLMRSRESSALRGRSRSLRTGDRGHVPVPCLFGQKARMTSFVLEANNISTRTEFMQL